MCSSDLFPSHDKIMEDIVLMADKSHSYMSPEMARWANVKYGNNKGALVEYKVGT